MEEGALGAAVALAEGMNGVELGEVVGEAGNEIRAVQAAKAILVGEVAQHAGEIRGDVLRQREQAGVLRDRNRAQLTGPRIYIPEDPAVHGLQMGGVAVAGDQVPLDLSDTAGADRCLKLSKLGGVTNPEMVSQHIGAGIDVWIVVSHRPTHIDRVRRDSAYA